MSEYGVVTADGSVRFERRLPGPIERVWEYLTDPEKRGLWLASGPMELWVGGRVELHFRHADLSPHAEPTPERYRQYEGAIGRGRVTACEQPRRLGYTWNEGPDGESEVTFELTSDGTEVLLVLTHRRLPDRAALLDVSGGWHTHLDILVDRLSGRGSRPFWSAHEAVEAEYEERIPAAGAVRAE